MNLYDIINEAYEKRIGKETTKLTKQDYDKIDNTSVFWIKKLKPSEKQKYAHLLIRLVDRKTGASVREIRYNGYRVPSIPQVKLIKEGIKNKKSPEFILKQILENSSYKRYTRRDKEKKTVTVKTYKSGIKKEKPLIQKLSNIMKRELTDREKDTIIYLKEKAPWGYKWNMEEMEGLLLNPKFQKELVKFEPWNADAFGNLIVQKEKNFFKEEDEYEKLKKERKIRELTAEEKKKFNKLKKKERTNPNPLKELKKNPVTLMLLSQQMKELDIEELEKYLKKNQSLIHKKPDNENINEYLKKVFNRLHNFFDSEANKYKSETKKESKKFMEFTSLLYIIDDFIKKINKTPFPVNKSAKFNIPEDYYEVKTLSGFISVLKDLVKFNHNDKALYDVFKNKTDSTLKIKDSTPDWKAASIQKKISESEKEKKDEFDSMISELKKQSDNIDIPAWTGNIDIRKYIKGLLMQISTKAGFLSIPTRKGMTSLIGEVGSETFLPENKPVNFHTPINNLNDLVNFIIKFKKDI